MESQEMERIRTEVKRTLVTAGLRDDDGLDQLLAFISGRGDQSAANSFYALNALGLAVIEGQIDGSLLSQSLLTAIAENSHENAGLAFSDLESLATTIKRMHLGSGHGPWAGCFQSALASYEGDDVREIFRNLRALLKTIQNLDDYQHHPAIRLMPEFLKVLAENARADFSAALLGWTDFIFRYHAGLQKEHIFVTMQVVTVLRNWQVGRPPLPPGSPGLIPDFISTLVALDHLPATPEGLRGLAISYVRRYDPDFPSPTGHGKGHPVPEEGNEEPPRKSPDSW